MLSILVFFLIPIVVIVTTFIFARNIAIFWGALTLTPLMSMYLGTFFLLLGSPGFVLSLQASLIVSIMTFLPLVLIVTIFYFNPNMLVTTECLSNEKIALEKQFKKLSAPIVVFFFILMGISLSEMFQSGNFFRSYYTNAVGANNTMLLLFTYTSGVLAFCLCLIKKQRVLTLVIFFCLLVLGKKHPILFCILLPIIWSLIYRRLNISKLIFFSIGAFVLLYVTAIIFADGRDIPFFLQMASTFDYMINFQYFLDTYTLGQNGGDIYLTGFYKYYPRYFWVEKPEIYGFLLIHSSIYANEVASGFFPSVFETYAIWLADFGYFGIIPYTIKSSLILFVVILKGLNRDYRFYIILASIDIFSLVIFLLFKYIWITGPRILKNNLAMHGLSAN